MAFALSSLRIISPPSPPLSRVLTNLFMKTNSFNKLFSNQQPASQPSYVLVILNQWPVFPLTSLPNCPFMMFC